MSIFLQVGDIFRFAMRVEEDGQLFYRRASLMAEDDKTQRLFERLADEEVRHKMVFEEMLSKIEEVRHPESYSGEYMAYLRDYIDNKVVFTKESKEEGFKDVHDIRSALDFAIRRELDSILYYQEVKQFIPKKSHGQIDKIIEEERSHFSVLSDLKKKYDKQASI